MGALLTLRRRASRTLAWLVVATAVATVLAVVAVPRVLGWVPLTVLTGSMSPALPVGSQAVVEPVDAAGIRDLEVGDVITFLPRPDDPTTVTHRIVGRSLGADGLPVFTTRGDANNADDPWRVTAPQLRGRVVYAVPYVGYLAHWVEEDVREALRVMLAGLLLLVAAREVLPRPRPAGGRHLGLAHATAPHHRSAGPARRRPRAPRGAVRPGRPGHPRPSRG